MNNELIERIDIELTGLQSVLDGAKATMPYERFAEISSPMDVLRDCKAALTQQQEAKPVPTGDERRLQHLGDEIHNASCTVIHLNEEIGEHLGRLASELWNWEKTHPPAAQPQVPEGEVLVPVELIKFIEAKEHHLPIEDRHVLSAMLSAHKEQS